MGGDQMGDRMNFIDRSERAVTGADDPAATGIAVREELESFADRVIGERLRDTRRSRGRAQPTALALS